MRPTQKFDHSPMSTSVYAQPTKEWVIPARPRPGRKPKKSETLDAHDDDDEAKKVQNRAAQRAFRERKQSQLADLQARLFQYEQGEIGRNVALQNLAKKLKEENETLRAENELLKSCVQNLDAKLAAAQKNSELPSAAAVGLKRSSSSLVDQDEPEDLEKVKFSSRKKNKSTRDPLNSLARDSSSASSSSTFSSSGVSTFSLTPLSHHMETVMRLPSSAYLPGSSRASSTTAGSQPAGAPLADIRDDEDPALGKSGLPMSGGTYDIVDCGCCSFGTPCICRQALAQSENLSAAGPPSNLLYANVGADNSMTIEASPLNKHMQPIKTEPTPHYSGISLLPMSSPSSSQTPTRTIYRLPSAAPAVRLPRRTNLAKSSPTNTAWLLVPAGASSPQQQDGPDCCTGDPANCAACADDPANQAFCAALGDAYGDPGDTTDAEVTAPPHNASSRIGREQVGSRCHVHFAEPELQMRISISDERSTAVDRARYTSPFGEYSNESPGLSTSASLFDGSLFDSPYPYPSIPVEGAGTDRGETATAESEPHPYCVSLCCGDPDLCGGGCGLPRSNALLPLPSLLFGTAHLSLPRPADHSLMPTAPVDTHRSDIVTSSSEDGVGSLAPSTSPQNADGRHVEGDLVPCNTAWAELRRHPNIGFADLSLLADVVARRDHIKVPTSIGSKRGAERDGGERGCNERRLVPQEHLVRNGFGQRRRVIQVQAQGVRDALALLDGVRTLR